MHVLVGSLIVLAAVQAPSSANIVQNDSAQSTHRAASLSTEEATELPIRTVADRTFREISDAVVAAAPQGGLANGVALFGANFMLQPTGAGIGGLCRSTEVMVHFGEERGPGTIPVPPETRKTPRRADDLSSRRRFKVAGPLHRLKTTEDEYAWDAACAARSDADSFMVTNLPNEDSLIPALIGIQHAIEKRHRKSGSSAGVFHLPPAWGGDADILKLEDVAAVRGVVDGDHVGTLEVIFAPGGEDFGYGAKMTIRDISWHWPPLDSPDYGVPSVSIGAIALELHHVIYD